MTDPDGTTRVTMLDRAALVDVARGGASADDIESLVRAACAERAQLLVDRKASQDRELAASLARTAAQLAAAETTRDQAKKPMDELRGRGHDANAARVTPALAGVVAFRLAADYFVVGAVDARSAVGMALIAAVFGSASVAAAGMVRGAWAVRIPMAAGALLGIAAEARVLEDPFSSWAIRMAPSLMALGCGVASGLASQGPVGALRDRRRMQRLDAMYRQKREEVERLTAERDRLSAAATAGAVDPTDYFKTLADELAALVRVAQGAPA